MSLYLIRHGETPLNVARVLQPLDTPLSERGRAQAAALGRRLQGLGLAGLLSSDVPRAVQTAVIVAAATGLPVHTSALLRERDFGALRGQPYDGLGFDPLTMENAPPQGESRADFEARAARAFAHVLAERARLAGPLAVITHGLVLRVWQTHHLHTGGRATARIGNTALTCIGPAAPFVPTLLNCTAHLEPAQANDAGGLVGG